jgi:hypothetical protein
MDLFCEIPCLVERSNTLDGVELCERWFPKSDKRNSVDALRKFVQYNERQFEFLDITASVEATKHFSGIAFRTSGYIGAIPLRSPDTGKQIGDFVVAPRFANRERFEDYIEILDLLGAAISPEMADGLPLASGRNFRPPFYLEAVKFVVALEKVLRKPWRKFDCVEVVRSEPTGQIDWGRYLQFESTGENKLKFPVRRNILSEFHREYRQLRFVFDICDRELRSSHVPTRIRKAFRSRLDFIEQRMYLHEPLAAASFTIKSSDRPAVKECKEQANRILKREHTSSSARRVDLNDVFEKFAQHIFEKVAHSLGGKISLNPNLQMTESSDSNLESRRLAPVAVLTMQELTVFIDAKFKSHLFVNSESNDDFDRDIQRVTEYFSFAVTDHSLGLICYPSDQIEVNCTVSTKEANYASGDKLVVGIPLKRSVIPDAVGLITAEIDRIRENFQIDA